MRAMHGLIAMLWISTLLVSHAAPDVDETFREAIAAFQDGDYRVAAEKLELLIEQDPHWSAGYVTLGQCHYLLGDPERGQASIQGARELDPEIDLFKAYYGAGQRLLREKRYEEAAGPVALALEHANGEQHRSTSLALGYAQLMAADYPAVREVLGQHQERYGAGFDSSFYLALASHKLGDYGSALDHLRTARAHGQGQERLDKLLGYLGRWSHSWALQPANKDRRGELIAQAVEDTRSWYEAAPDDPVALRYYAETLLAAGRSDAAVEQLTTVAGRDERNCTALVLLAKAFNAQRDGVKAGEWASRATGCDPSSVAAHVELGVANIQRLHEDHSSLEEVQRDLELVRAAMSGLRQALELGEQPDPRARELLADARATLQRLQQAEADFLARDAQHQADLERAEQARIRKRCQSILWKMSTESADLTVEERQFFKDHDCRKYDADHSAARRSGP